MSLDIRQEHGHWAPATSGNKKGRPKGAIGRSWRKFWKHRALAPRDRWVLPMVELYQDELASDKPEATAGELRLMEIASVCRAVSLLILNELAQEGLFRSLKDGHRDVTLPGKELTRYLNLERSVLRDLGLERRAKNVPGLVVSSNWI